MSDDPAPGLDDAALQRLRDLDPTGKNHLLERVMAAFESSSLRMSAQLAEARKTDDHDAIRLVAHTLKSSAASIGALELARLCAEIEAQVRSTEQAGLIGRLDAMDRELHVVLQMVRPMLKSPPR
ncbi:MAG: Hpt domain-containing protein [Caldimonas sp.]